MKWLCNHLGHTCRVHDQYYRQTSGLIERIDISKLMIMQEHNLVAKCNQKSLSEIQFDESDTLTVSFEEIIKIDDGSMGKCNKNAKPVNRVKWSNEEEEEIMRYFKKYFHREVNKTSPSQHDCKAAVAFSEENGGQLQKRSWETIKKKVSRMLKSKVLAYEVYCYWSLSDILAIILTTTNCVHL
ncbi:uncharacterized protein LOC117344151 [Pecten maximus]|uniref:uncharacterized protein LOC117344151 n=1 Tax=Pecten maximus TaxID=6579 RepID=UPI001458723C|nr:uncharacterized protein LOC117344151 [Pecten maximus]